MINVMSYAELPMLFPIPATVGKGITQAALWIALALALTVNRRGLFRANLFLGVCTLLALISFETTFVTFHVGSIYRAVRLCGFLTTLWLLTPWFGRRDMLLMRCHLRCMTGIVAFSFLGLAFGGKAFDQGRFDGIFWPIPSTQLAHYAAVMTGLGAVLWLTGVATRRSALLLTVTGVATILLTHTRTALIAVIIGIVLAGCSLFLARRRARRVLVGGISVALVLVVALLPFATHWFERGESGQSFTDLSGRTLVWHKLLNTPRDRTQVLFGGGLSNDSFEGLSIDDSWLAAYMDQGLVGDILIGTFLLVLVVQVVIRPPDAPRALAAVLLGYCLIASYAEVGLGDASSYLLDLTVAASLLAIPSRAVGDGMMLDDELLS